MKKLLLLRHAKAVRESHGGDHARVLNARGRENAGQIGGYLHVHGLTPDHVLCSTATRTKETWQFLQPELNGAPEPAYLDALYLAAWKAILKIIREAPDNANTLLVIGHNPGLEDCAMALSDKPDSSEEKKRMEAMREKFPTCALAFFECDIEHWEELTPGCNTLAEFVRPKDFDDD